MFAFEKFKKYSIIFCMFALISFSLPQAIAAIENNNPENMITVEREVSNGSDMELVQNEVSIDDSEIEPIDTNKVKKTIVPDPQKEGKKVIGLFLKTMALVGFCVIVLCFGLIFVRKFWASAFINRDFEELESLDLSTPDNIQNAVHSFLNRTK